MKNVIKIYFLISNNFSYSDTYGQSWAKKAYYPANFVAIILHKNMIINNQLAITSINNCYT